MVTSAMSMRAVSIKRLGRLWGGRAPVPPPVSTMHCQVSFLDHGRLFARAMGIFVITAVVLETDAPFGVVLDETKSWAIRHKCPLVFSTLERRIWHGDEHLARSARSQILDGVEALYAICWVLGLAKSMPLRSHVPDALGALFPDMLADESQDALRARVACQPAEIVAQELDVYLCAHWLIRQAALSGEKRPFTRPHIIIQRRLALEWCCSDQEWDDVELDT